MPEETFLISSLQKNCKAVLEAMAGESGEVRVTNTTPGAGAGQWLWMKYAAQEPGVVLTAGASEESWRSIAKTVLAETDDEPNEDHRPTYLELLNQIAATVYRDITAKAGRELTASPAETNVPSEGYAFLAEIDLPGRKPAAIVFVASAPLLGVLEPPAPKQKQAVQPAAADGPPRTMDLLLDVELPVSVSFGRTLLPLRDVIKLTSGSIIELSRAVTEPVELIVNNCVIARGEVVVVEGNYGVKITQIVSRHERLRTLH